MVKKNMLLFVTWGIFGFFLFFGIGNGVFANEGEKNCPKISINPETKEISIVSCDVNKKGISELKKNENENKVDEEQKSEKDVKKNDEKNDEKKEKIGEFIRLSKKNECPQIFVNNRTKDIKVVQCGQKIENVEIKSQNEKLNQEKKNLINKENKEKNVAKKKDISAISGKPEFDQALEWMYANGLTKYNNKKDYRPNDPLLREEAAKMFGKAYQVFGYDVKAMKNKQCEFLDEKKFNLELVSYINDVCHWGLFKGTDERKFLPKYSLKKSESTAVLLRMLEGKLSYEKLTPWWTNYYQKAFLLGITKVDNINIYDKIQNRKEIALMLWRFKQVVENKNKDKWLKQIEKIDANSSSGLQLKNWEQDLNKVLGDIDFEKDPELIEAINWMHDKGLTNFQSVKSYMPTQALTRGQAAKIFDIFSKALGRKVKSDILPNACIFSDIANLSSENILYIQNVCKKGLMHGDHGKFNPNEKILKSHFMVILVRLFDDTPVVSNGTPWWQGYFQRARELGLVDISDINTFDKAIRRYEVALFLYRFNVRYNIVNNINTTTVDKQLITTIEKTKKTQEGKKTIEAYINMSLFDHNDLELAYIYFFDTRYKIVKSLKREYIDNAFVWYGDIFDIVDNKKLGTMNLVIRNDKLISGGMRLKEKNYVLEKKNGLDAYFTVIEN